MGIEAVRAEFAGETKKTRKQLERLRDDVLEWRPHPKSYTAGGLASHLVECVRLTEKVLAADEHNFGTGAVDFKARSVADLLETYDAVALAAARHTGARRVRAERRRSVITRFINRTNNFLLFDMGGG